MVSKNAIALVVLALSTIGINVSEEAVLELISAIGTLVSFGLMVWNQLDRKDTELFFFKKK